MRSVRSSLTPQSPPPIAPIRSSDSSHSEWPVSPGQTQSGSNTVRQPLPSRCPRSLTSCWADKERHTVLSKTMLSCWETRNCFKPLLDRDPVFPFFPFPHAPAAATKSSQGPWSTFAASSLASALLGSWSACRRYFGDKYRHVVSVPGSPLQDTIEPA